ncbi:hypothetical protein R1flu_021786 [Riccia fluitans]|uniref:Uncharacterized protein n=1 Tax=Riccia fluitans TaxID=41844 RepID=A0ABD1ZQK1_9MARC
MDSKVAVGGSLIGPGKVPTGLRHTRAGLGYARRDRDGSYCGQVLFTLRCTQFAADDQRSLTWERDGQWEPRPRECRQSMWWNQERAYQIMKAEKNLHYTSDRRNLNDNKRRMQLGARRRNLPSSSGTLDRGSRWGIGPPAL